MRHIASSFILIIAVHGFALGDSFEKLAPEIRGGYVPEQGTTEGGLWMKMNAVEEQFKNSPLRVTDPQLNLYISQLICKLANEHCKDIRPYIIRHPGFNAFMAPNGMMVLWSGLLLRSRNEAQLATVIGHEIGHYLRKHSVKSFNPCLPPLEKFLAISNSYEILNRRVALQTASLRAV